MTESELESLIRERLIAANLLDYVDGQHSQFLHMGGDGFFVELVLRDASKLEVARGLASEVTDSLRRDDIKVSWVIGANWKLEKIEHIGPCRAPDGGLRAADCFRAVLSSAHTVHSVQLEVTMGAFEDLKYRLGEKKPQTYQQTNALVIDVLRAMVSEWLRRGGESRWDPQANSVVQLTHPFPATCSSGRLGFGVYLKLRRIFA